MSVKDIINGQTGKILDKYIPQGGGVGLAKGQLLSADSGGAEKPLSAGVNGTLLTANSNADLGLEWLAPGHPSQLLAMNSNADGFTWVNAGGGGGGGVSVNRSSSSSVNILPPSKNTDSMICCFDYPQDSWVAVKYPGLPDNPLITFVYDGFVNNFIDIIGVTIPLENNASNGAVYARDTGSGNDYVLWFTTSTTTTTKTSFVNGAIARLNTTGIKDITFFGRFDSILPTGKFYPGGTNVYSGFSNLMTMKWFGNIPVPYYESTYFGLQQQYKGLGGDVSIESQECIIDAILLTSSSQPKEVHVFYGSFTRLITTTADGPDIYSGVTFYSFESDEDAFTSAAEVDTWDLKFYGRTSGEYPIIEGCFYTTEVGFDEAKLFFVGKYAKQDVLVPTTMNIGQVAVFDYANKAWFQSILEPNAVTNYCNAVYPSYKNKILLISGNNTVYELDHSTYVSLILPSSPCTFNTTPTGGYLAPGSYFCVHNGNMKLESGATLEPTDVYIGNPPGGPVQIWFKNATTEGPSPMEFQYIPTSNSINGGDTVYGVQNDYTNNSIYFAATNNIFYLDATITVTCDFVSEFVSNITTYTKARFTVPNSSQMFVSDTTAKKWIPIGGSTTGFSLVA